MSKTRHDHTRLEQQGAGPFVGRHTVALPPDERASHLAAARELRGFRFGDERTDIRHWPVFASDGRFVGLVDRLMVETYTGRIRYVAVALDRHAADDDFPTPCGSVLVPVGILRRLEGRETIELDGLDSRTLVCAPRLRDRAVTRADENATLASYGLPTSRDLGGGALYDGPAFDERRLMLSSTC